MEALRYEVTCPKSHSQEAVELGREPRPTWVQQTLPPPVAVADAG